MRNSKQKFDLRKQRIRSKISQNSDRLRMSLFKSNRHIHVQIIDDNQGVTLVSASTLEKNINKIGKSNCNVASAEAVGALIGERALAAGIKEVVFDRSGYQYHGLVKSLADSARKFLNF